MKVIITQNHTCETGSVQSGEVCQFVGFSMNEKKQGTFKVKKNNDTVVKVPASYCQIG